MPALWQRKEELLPYVALHEAGHAVMGRTLGAIITSVELPMEFETGYAGQVSYRWPFCRIPRDRDNLLITLAGPAVSLVVKDPLPLWHSRGDIKDAETIVSAYVPKDRSKQVVIDLLVEVVDLINNSPTFMKSVYEEALRFTQ